MARMIAHTINGSTVARSARSHKDPGISRIIGTASGMSLTVEVTAKPIPRATAAAMRICMAEPGVNVVFQSRCAIVFLGFPPLVSPDVDTLLVVACSMVSLALSATAMSRTGGDDRLGGQWRS